MQIKFLRPELYENEGRLKGVLYEEGRVYDLPPDQANRWLSRGAAEIFSKPERRGLPLAPETHPTPAPASPAVAPPDNRGANPAR